MEKLEQAIKAAADAAKSENKNILIMCGDDKGFINVGSIDSESLAGMLGQCIYDATQKDAQDFDKLILRSTTMAVATVAAQCKKYRTILEGSVKECMRNRKK